MRHPQRAIAALLLAAGPLLVAAATVRVTVVNGAGSLLSDAVVLLEPLGAKVAPRPVSGLEVSQRDKQFQPRVAVVPVGSAVDFPNRDTVKHHVYSFSEAKRFEIKLYVGRPEKPVVFDRPGIVVLGCNIHDSMLGWIVVTDTPWHGRSGPDGQVTLAQVPAGSYRLRTWHPVLPAGSGGLEQALNVGGDAELTVRLGGPP